MHTRAWLHDAPPSRLFDLLALRLKVVLAILAPVAPAGSARLRAVVAANHSLVDLQHCADNLIEGGRRLGIICLSTAGGEQLAINSEQLVGASQKLRLRAGYGI